MSGVEIEEREFETDDDIIQRRVEELQRRRKQICLRKVNISGMLLKSGDIIRIRIKGFAREEVIAVFICFNPMYNWIRLKLDDSEMIVKLGDVRYIRRETWKEKREGEEGGADTQPNT
ncbi:MAG TPA: hypothetical protein VNK96_04070 [Fimbriimonadales bacterium]|nr:hypothetical protein [Fimbriimonadales bacterium]